MTVAPWRSSFRLAALVAMAMCSSCAERPAPVAPDARAGGDGIALSWPATGPPELWSRDLGPGYAGIAARDDRVCTMYRDHPEEVVLCLDARTGETLWRYRYESSPAEGHDSDYGDGPNAAPVLTEHRLYTIGVAGVLHCFDADDGRVLWSHDLWREFGGNFVDLGYSSSPVIYGETVITLVGGRGQAIVAFDRETGRVVWKDLDFSVSFASPAIMNMGGRDQLVAFMATEVVGADPHDGQFLWKYPIRNHYPQNICPPVRTEDGLIFVSTTEAGARGLRVTAGDPFEVEAAWSSARIQCFYTWPARIGDFIYLTSGATTPFLTAVHASTGKIAWRERGFGFAHIVAVDNRLVILGDDGLLSLASPGPEGLTVHARARILSEPSLTPPTIVDNILYARDFHRILALDLAP